MTSPCACARALHRRERRVQPFWRADFLIDQRQAHLLRRCDVLLEKQRTDTRSGGARARAGSVVRRGQSRGDKFADSLVLGRAGQTLKVEMKGSHPQNYFNLTSPGSGWVMFVGSSSGDRVERVLPVDGLYVVRVYLMRAAARRDAVSQYTLTLGLSGEALRARDPAQDALVAGAPFHARATIPCRQAMEPARTACQAAVIRYQRADCCLWAVASLGPMQWTRRVRMVWRTPNASMSVRMSTMWHRRRWCRVVESGFQKFPITPAAAGRYRPFAPDAYHAVAACGRAQADCRFCANARQPDVRTHPGCARAHHTPKR